MSEGVEWAGEEGRGRGESRGETKKIVPATFLPMGVDWNKCTL